MDVVDKDKEYTFFAGRRSPIVDCVVALAAGVLTTLSAAPFSLWWLGPVSVALVYWRRDMSTQKICCLSMQAANGGVRPDVPARKGGKGLGIAE